MSAELWMVPPVTRAIVFIPLATVNIGPNYPLVLFLNIQSSEATELLPSGDIPAKLPKSREVYPF